MSAGLKDILAIPPTTAWLLIGDEASFPTASDLRDNRRRPLTDDQIWTGSKQTQPGDLLFFYFVAPRKAIHFAARAASYPLFDSKIGVNAKAVGDPTVLMVVDRVDLVNQTSRQFETTGLPKLMVPATSNELRMLLSAEDHRGVIITTIHKFAGAGLLNSRDNIVVLIDEAHRTQEGSLAADMRVALPNARFFGMTGTPVADSDRDTFRLFGDPDDPDFVMSLYAPERSVADGTTVPVHLEARLVDFHLDAEALDEAVDDLAAAEDLNDEQQALLTKKAGRWRTVMLAPIRIQAVCADIVEHYHSRVGPLGQKAQVVAADRELVVAYAEEIRRIITERDLPYEVGVDMTVTNSKDEKAAFKPYLKDDSQLVSRAGSSF